MGLYKITEAEQKIYEVCANLFEHTTNVKVSIPELRFGHMSTNAPIIYSKSVGKSIDEIYQLLEPKLLELDFVESVELVRGFCNLRFTEQFLTAGLQDVLTSKTNYGAKSRENSTIKVNIEYISANPTGDLHLGHVRGIYGDILARYLRFVGYDVTREYYVNNVGNQVFILGRSVYYEYTRAKGIEFPKPEEMYPGEHIESLGREIAASESSYSWDNEEDRTYFINLAVEKMLERIRSELKILNIEFDKWRYEAEVHAGGYVTEAISSLEKRGYIVEEVLDEVKSKRGKASNQPIKVFRTKNQDSEAENHKAITRPDGSYTYFAADIGYHYLKIKEGYNWIIDSFGADHHLHAEMLSEVVPLLDESTRLTMMVFQIVKFRKDKQELKFSKRGGVTLKPSEVLDYLPDPNILRFVMASKQHDTHFIIDIDEIGKISIDNAFYSVQYAHARSCSVLRNAGTMFKSLNLSNANLSDYSDSMIELLYLLLQWPRELALIEHTLSVHNIVNYLQKVTKKFHSIWSKKGARWIVQDDAELTGSRLALVLAFKYTVATALAILGIEAYDELKHAADNASDNSPDFGG